MGKTLLGRHNIEQYICHEKQTLYLDSSFILSPGGKDYLQEKGVAVIYGQRPAAVEKQEPSCCSAGASAAGVKEAIDKILMSDYQITDVAQRAAITSAVLKKLGSGR